MQEALTGLFEQAERDVDWLIEQLEGLQLRQIQSESVTFEVTSFEDLGSLDQQLHTTLTELGGLLDLAKDIAWNLPPNSAASSSVALNLLTTANATQPQLDWIQTNLSELLASIGRKLRSTRRTMAGVADSLREFHQKATRSLLRLKQALIPKLGVVLKSIWQLISRLLTPKEWKLKGDVGTGILGLVNVGIEITFGP